MRPVLPRPGEVVCNKVLKEILVLLPSIDVLPDRARLLKAGIFLAGQFDNEKELNRLLSDLNQLLEEPGAAEGNAIAVLP